MPAPLLVLYAPPSDRRPDDHQPAAHDAQPGAGGLGLLDLGPARGLLEHRRDPGHRHAKCPGWLEPGESITVPVYYAGMQQPWSFVGDRASSSTVDYYTQHDTTALDWSSLEASLQPPGISNTAWSAIFSGLTSQIGDTWGGYVTMLDDEASYLGQLGENVTDVSELWAFAVMQADGLTPMPVLASVTDLDVAVPGDLSLDFTPDLSRADQRARRAGTARLRLDRRLAVLAERRLRRHGHRHHALGRTAHLPARQPRQRLLRSSPATTASSPRAPAARSRSRSPTVRSRRSTPTARSTTSRTPTATASRPATRGSQLTSLTDTLGRVADDRLQRGRADRVGHQLRRPDGRLHLRFRRALDRRHELRRRGDAVHVRGGVGRGDGKRAGVDHESRRHVPEFHLQRRRPADRHIAGRRRGPRDLQLQRRAR